jgi:hypothetical protein
MNFAPTPKAPTNLGSFLASNRALTPSREHGIPRSSIWSKTLVRNTMIVLMERPFTA